MTPQHTKPQSPECYQIIAYDLQGKTHLIGSQLDKATALATVSRATENPIYKAVAMKWA